MIASMKDMAELEEYIENTAGFAIKDVGLSWSGLW